MRVVGGKMAESLLHGLVSNSELSNLSPELQNKLEGILVGLQCKIDSLKAQHEQFRVDSGKILIVFSLRSVCLGDYTISRHTSIPLILLYFWKFTRMSKQIQM